MEHGTYAVDPEPFGGPWRRWAEVGDEEAAARGVFAPVEVVSYGPAGAVVVAPGDVRGTVLIPEQCEGCCFGISGATGPNLACEACGREVATRVDDCSLWQGVWLDPRSVRRVRGPRPGVAGWDELATRWSAAPLIESHRIWWSGTGLVDTWSLRWAAAAGVALVDLLIAADAEPVGLPGDSLLTELFGTALDRFLPAGRPTRTVGLAGPGVDSGADIVVVPVHPQTGEAWRPERTAGAVPLDAEVWLHLAFGAPEWESLPVPASGGMPEGVWRDYSWPRPPGTSLLRLDPWVFLHRLARHPAVREPWLRAIYDQGFF
ncbi:hypothetical protein [Streptomyces sp. 4F14]|uniref:hypothetical protein n=1 Tax=Streptomyces sp. 4F14 TaxID=3394380 RepID=UPI003A883EBD